MLEPQMVLGTIFLFSTISAWSGLLIELFERFSILGFPPGKPVCAPAVYNNRRRRWARKPRILSEDQEVIFEFLAS
jgi:hypothetical protein